MTREQATMSVDMELLQAASRVLGTDDVSDTVDRALHEVVNLERRRALLQEDFPHLTAERLTELRQGRTYDVDLPDQH